MNGPPRHGPLSALRKPDALLALEDGTVFFGHSCGAVGEMSGELVFNTSMTGYPEIITDPSYRGQIITFTYPLIGNYGVNSEDAEGPKPVLSGVVVRTMCGEPSSWRSRESLPDYLRRHRIVAIEGVDTRALTRKLRSAGVMRAVLSTRDLDPESLVAKARASAGLAGRDLVAEVTPMEATPWLQPVAPGAGAATAAASPGSDAGAGDAGDSRETTRPAIALPDWMRREADVLERGDPAILAVEAMLEARRGGRPLVLPRLTEQVRMPRARPAPGAPLRIAVLHCGMKSNIAAELRKRGALVRVYPSSEPIGAIVAEGPDGLVLSNGPGDPEAVAGVVDAVREVIGKVPIFGICLGIQMVALAFGGRTFKLKFGHRGGNQPVLDLATGKVEITSQNHGYAVDPTSLMPEGPDDPREGLVISHVNLNDGTVEGIAHPGLRVMAVQYHPEAAPGPHDAAYLFDRFLTEARSFRAKRKSDTPAGHTVTANATEL